MSPSSFQDKVYLLTGGASGIGYSTAHTLLAKGASVALCDINQKALDDFTSALDAKQHDRILARSVDITTRASVRAFVDETKKRFGRLDGVANIAGTAGHRLGREEVWEISDDEYDFVMDVNLRGAFVVLGETLRPGVLEKGASVVHVSSMYGERAFTKGSVYAASKWAGIGLVKSAAKEAAARGIRVNIVLPGPIDTPMLRGNEGGEGTSPDTPLARLGESQEVANIIAVLLSDESAYVTGATWSVDGGANL